MRIVFCLNTPPTQHKQRTRAVLPRRIEPDQIHDIQGETYGGAERDRTADLVIANNVLCCLLKGDGRGFLIPGLQVAVETPGECLGGLQIPCPGRFDGGLAADGHPKLKVPGSVNFEA